MSITFLDDNHPKEEGTFLKLSPLFSQRLPFLPSQVFLCGVYTTTLDGIKVIGGSPTGEIAKHYRASRIVYDDFSFKLTATMTRILLGLLVPGPAARGTYSAAVRAVEQSSNGRLGKKLIPSSFFFLLLSSASR
jgi:hypothetical protein